MPQAQGISERETPLRRAGLALYRLAWGLLFAATLVMPVLAAIRLAGLSGPAADSRATPALPFQVEAWLLYSLNLVPAVFLATGAVLLFWRCGRERVAMILSFSFLCSAASMPYIEPWLAAGPFENLRELVEFAAPLTGILGMMLFPDGRFVPRWMVVPAVLLVPWTLSRVFHLLPFYIDLPLNDVFGLLVIASVLIRYRGLPVESQQRQQIRWAVSGIAVGLVLNTFALILFMRMTMPMGDEPRSWMLIAARTLLIGFYIMMPGGLLISLLRYRLYDADAVITRSAALAGTTLLLAAIFAGSAEGIKWLIESGLGRDAGFVPGVIAAALTTLLVTPAHERLREWSAARFQHALLHMRNALPTAVGDLRETASLDELLDEVLARIGAGTRARRLAVLRREDGGLVPAAVHGTSAADIEDWLAGQVLDDQRQQLDSDRDDPRFPLRIPLCTDDAPALIGWLLLGPRPDGSFYGKDERDALAEIAGPVARAIRIVELREAREQQAQARARRQERRIAALERKLAELTQHAAKPGGGDPKPVARSPRNGRSKRNAPATARE
jgi:hypothetical protein